MITFGPLSVLPTYLQSFILKPSRLLCKLENVIIIIIIIIIIIFWW